MVEEGSLIADAPSWTDSISEENRGGVKDFTSVDDLAKGYGALFTKLGTSVQMPNDESTPEDRSAFYQKLGAKQTGTEYTRPDVPEGKDLDEAFFTHMATAAAKGGVSDGHLSFLMREYVTYQDKIDTMKAEAKEVRADNYDRELREKWVSDYDKNSESARRALNELVPEEIKEPLFALLKEKELEYHPLMKQLLHSIGDKILDDTLVKGELPKKTDDGYVPAYPNSPQMYADDDTEEGAKARTWHEAHGHKYG